MVKSLPCVGAKVRVPKLPGGAALAAPPESNTPHAAVAMTAGAALSWQENLLRTIELTSLSLFPHRSRSSRRRTRRRRASWGGGFCRGCRRC